MNLDKRKIYLFLLLLLFGCNKPYKVEFIGLQHKNLFFIEAEKFGNLVDAELFAEKLKTKIAKKIYLRFDSTNTGKFYSVCIGEFSNSYSAGEFAFNLFRGKLRYLLTVEAEPSAPTKNLNLSCLPELSSSALFDIIFVAFIPVKS